MVTLLKKQIIIFVAVLIISINVSAQTLSPDNWTKYCGWHYGNTPAWGGWVRDFVQHSTGFDLIDTVNNTLTIDTVKLNSLYNSLATINPSVDIMQLDGGLGQAKDTIKSKAFINIIKADSATFWKSLVYKQCNKLAQLPNSENRLYYQLGNEISSAALSSSLRYAQGLSYSSGSDYDHFIIPSFVELYMAPTIEAIDSSSVFNFGAKGKIKICLGSITNAGNNAAQPFLDSLLNYTITGTYAPSLAGKKVYELIHIITIHYMMGNSSMNIWQNKLNEYANWIGTGRVQGVWSTEEVGINKAMSGAGAAYSARATFRYLKWAIESGYTSRVARTNYWAWDLGPANTQVNNFNAELYDFLGNTKLSYVSPLNTVYTNSATIEWYGFLNDSANKGILAIPGTTTQTISQVKLVNNGWGNISSVSLTRYDTTGNFNIPVTLNFLTDSVLITFPVQNLSITTVLLLKINTQPLTTGVDDGRENLELPLRYELEQNYPNPFNPSTVISYQLPVSCFVTLKVYDVLGREAATLVDEYKQPGIYTINFNGESLPSGVYFYRLITENNYSLTRKMIFMK